MSHPFRFLWLALALALAACAAPPSAPAPAVDSAQTILFYNGVILTLDPAQPSAEALLVRGQTIEAVGREADLRARQEAGTLLIDLAGRTLMPGFVDAHTHVLNDARSLGLSLDQAQALALRHGITTLGDLYVDEAFLRQMQAFDAGGALRVRTSLYLVANTNCGQPMGDWYKRYPPTRAPGEMLRIGGIKLFTDGGSCGGVALSFELEPGLGQGDLWLTQAELNALVAEAQAAGYQAAIHAIGDRAVAQAQTAVAAALAGGPNLYRHRLEHVSVLRPEQLARFGELGLVPVLNGEYPACTPFGPPVPEPYHAWEWPWRDLRAANPDLAIAWHSDYPFLSINPFVHLYGFVTRIDARAYYTCPAGAWLQDDTLTVPEALSIMTIESAYALFRETEVGSLEPGKYADLIVVSGDPLTVPAADLKSLSVLATMVGGRWEFCNPRQPDVCPGYVARTPLPLPDLRPPVAVRWLVLALVIALPLAAGLLLRLAAARPWLARLGAVCALAGGGLWAWAWVWGPQSGVDDITWAGVGAGLLLLLAVIGLAAAERPPLAGALGLGLAALGLLSLVLGTLLSGWFAWDEGWLLLILGVLIHALGLMLLGGANLFARRWSLRHWLPLAAGLVGGVLPMVVSSINWMSDWPSILLGYGLGGGWLLLGLLLWRTQGKPIARAAPVAGL